jgi:hypothetical protein
MNKPPDPGLSEKLAGLVVSVRNNSLQGRLTPLSDCWQDPPELLFQGISEYQSEVGDVESVREGEDYFLFSTRFMSRRYAETAALVSTGETVRIISWTVRDESATYPRPTSVDVFTQHPYSLTPGDVQAAVAELTDSAAYPDISRVTASDGSVFLYSSDHMTRDQARSMAEWIAVGDAENP